MQALSQLSYGPVTVRSGDRRLMFVLADVRVDNAADVVVFVFFFLKKTGIVFFLVAEFFVCDGFDLVGAIGIDDGHAGILGFVFGADRFFLFLVIIVRRDHERR